MQSSVKTIKKKEDDSAVGHLQLVLSTHRVRNILFELTMLSSDLTRLSCMSSWLNPVVCMTISGRFSWDVTNCEV